MANLEKFFVPQYDKAGIYAVINKTKMKAYIGQSTNIKNRATQHKSLISNGKHNVKEITRDAEDEFSFLVVHKFYDENVSKEKLNLYEKLYMLTFAKAGFELYNKNEGCKNSDVFNIAWSISCDLMYSIGTMENLKDAYFDKYEKHYSYDIKTRDNKKYKKH